jgi:hypothetical protein
VSVVRPVLAFKMTSFCSRPERVAKIAEGRFALDPTSVLDNIRIARVFNVDDQLDLNLAIAAMLADEDGEHACLVPRVAPRNVAPQNRLG